MTRIAYVARRFNRKSEAIIMAANAIIAEYEAQGYSLTLRQLFYQFVARGLIANTQRSYGCLGDTISAARLAGEIDWEAIEDRTRFIRRPSYWFAPQDILNSAAGSYRRNLWEDQLYAPEVWIEKDALIGVIEGICMQERVPCFSCRGYVSQSEMWVAGQRMIEYIEAGRQPIIFHLGDHDPSGIDMTRDIRERLEMFVEESCTETLPDIRRIALTIEQVRELNPPPNPAKETDTRSKGYIRKFGDKSWELDALDPAALCKLIIESIDGVRDEMRWARAVARERKERKSLARLAETYKGG